MRLLVIGGTSFVGRHVVEAALAAGDDAAGKAAGLVVRPLGETAADTLAWDRERGLPPLSGAPTPEQERSLREKWAERS